MKHFINFHDSIRLFYTLPYIAKISIKNPLTRWCRVNPGI